MSADAITQTPDPPAWEARPLNVSWGTAFPGDLSQSSAAASSPKQEPDISAGHHTTVCGPADTILALHSGPFLLPPPPFLELSLPLTSQTVISVAGISMSQRHTQRGPCHAAPFAMPGLPDLPSTGAWAHEQTDPICIPPDMVSS